MSLQVLITLAVAVAVVVAQAPLGVITPAPPQACLPTQLTWSGGVAPYFVSIIPGAQPSAAPLKDFGKQDGTSLTWNVDQPANSEVSVQIRDSIGTINYSDKVKILPSSQTCATGSSSGGNSSSTSPAKPGSTSPTNSTPVPSGGKQGGSSSSSPSTTTPTTGGSSTAGAPSTPASTSAPASDASRNIPGFVAVGLSAAIAILA